MKLNKSNSVGQEAVVHAPDGGADKDMLTGSIVTSEPENPLGLVVLHPLMPLEISVPAIQTCHDGSILVSRAFLGPTLRSYSSWFELHRTNGHDDEDVGLLRCSDQIGLELVNVPNEACTSSPKYFHHVYRSFPASSSS